MTHDRLTCVVPTHNRPHFLRRLLHFYSQFPPGFPFLIVDSSNLVAAAENREVVQGVHGKLDIDYQHFDLNITDKCVQGLERVRSPFVVFCADDDYLFSDTVWRCVEFLENEPGFATAMGRTAQLNPKLPRWCCRVLKGYSIEHDLPFERCRQLATNWFSDFYAVYRTELMLDIFQITAANTNSSLNYHLPEMLFSQLSVLRGRVKVLPTMSSLRERHSANAGRGQRSGERPQAQELYQRFKTGLVQQFVRTGIEQAEAERFIDDWYGYFREPSLTRWRRRRSVGDVFRQLLNGAKDRWLDLIQNEGTRHRRFVRSSDLVGCESMWDAAVKLMREFPQGIAVESSQTQRCA